MKKKKNSYSPLVIGLGILLIILVISGVTYAFYTANITRENENNNVIIKTENLSLTYNGNISTIGTIKKPNDSLTSKFTVKNTSENVTVPSYNISFVDVNNNIINDEYVYELSCISYSDYGLPTQEVSGTCTGKSETPVPTTNELMHTSSSIAKDITHEYKLVVTFIDTGSNQNYNQNKSVNFKLIIE
ncbi:MAG: hypothetical protein GX864_02215 [Mollicutes bacterium]|nr:hypothetical protein [Mollicutes bacterium]